MEMPDLEEPDSCLYGFAWEQAVSDWEYNLIQMRALWNAMAREAGSPTNLHLESIVRLFSDGITFEDGDFMSGGREWSVACNTLVEAHPTVHGIVLQLLLRFVAPRTPPLSASLHVVSPIGTFFDLALTSDAQVTRYLLQRIALREDHSNFPVCQCSRCAATRVAGQTFGWTIHIKLGYAAFP